MLTIEISDVRTEQRHPLFGGEPRSFIAATVRAAGCTLTVSRYPDTEPVGFWAIDSLSTPNGIAWSHGTGSRDCLKSTVNETVARALEADAQVWRETPTTPAR